jgi:hypothetical protein
MRKDILITITILLFASCSKDKLPEPVGASRTIIAYIAADNDLYADALSDMEEMQQGFSETGVRLIIFADVSGEAPYLLEVGKDKENRIKTYDELNSADAGTLQTVIREIIGLYPADEYGLILWSHGTSWLPAGIALRSFGNDSGREMNIPGLAGALPVKFDFILMDACLMGAVEVAYELREKTDYLIASSTETIYTGFPYDKIVPELLNPQIDFKAVAQCYFDYYNGMKGVYRSATVSVVATKYLSELASQSKLLFENNVFDMELFNKENVQRLDIYEEQYCFDLLDFVNKVFPNADKRDFITQLEKVVMYKNHTPQFIMQYDINTYCGLSCYIPHPQRNDLNTYYQQLQWCKTAGFSQLFKP